MAGPVDSLRKCWDLIQNPVPGTESLKIEPPEPVNRFLGCQHRLSTKVITWHGGDPTDLDPTIQQRIDEKRQRKAAIREAKEAARKEALAACAEARLSAAAPNPPDQADEHVAITGGVLRASSQAVGLSTGQDSRDAAALRATPDASPDVTHPSAHPQRGDPAVGGGVLRASPQTAGDSACPAREQTQHPWHTRGGRRKRERRCRRSNTTWKSSSSPASNGTLT